MKVYFRTDNSAFDEFKEGEISRILRSIAHKVESGSTSGKVIDVNGNSIGDWEV